MSAGVRVCAYCGASGSLTREHLWPAAIIARAGVDRSYFGKHERFVDAELKIRDVCAACNNGPLSALDAYGCSLFEGQFSRQAVRREPRIFLYDYEKLLRWLLKISFNVARANDSDVASLSTFASYMLKGGLSPSNVEVRLELVYPSPNPHWTPGSSAMKTIPARTIRCARVLVSGQARSECVLRLIALHSYYFWIAIFPGGRVGDGYDAPSPGKLLLPNADRVSVTPSRGMLEVHDLWISNPRAKESLRALRQRGGA